MSGRRLIVRIRGLSRVDRLPVIGRQTPAPRVPDTVAQGLQPELTATAPGLSRSRRATTPQRGQRRTRRTHLGLRDHRELHEPHTRAALRRTSGSDSCGGAFQYVEDIARCLTGILDEEDRGRLRRCHKCVNRVYERNVEGLMATTTANARRSCAPSPLWHRLRPWA